MSRNVDVLQVRGAIARLHDILWDWELVVTLKEQRRGMWVERISVAVPTTPHLGSEANPLQFIRLHCFIAVVRY